MPDRITGWQAHVYYDPDATRGIAAALREAIAERFPAAVFGRWHDRPVGPHPIAMYQVAFGPELLAGLLSFLALQRAGLTILVHPETGHPRADHSAHALWLGDRLPLDIEFLPE